MTLNLFHLIRSLADNSTVFYRVSINVNMIPRLINLWGLLYHCLERRIGKH